MKDVINRDGEIYLSGSAVLTIIIGEAVEMTEPKPHLKCKRILEEMSRLMAIRGYGKSAMKIYSEIINIKDYKEQKKFADEIYNQYIFPKDIQFLLCNTEVM